MGNPSRKQTDPFWLTRDPKNKLQNQFIYQSTDTFCFLVLGRHLRLFYDVRIKGPFLPMEKTELSSKMTGLRLTTKPDTHTISR